jgi:hypothetical protein
LTKKPRASLSDVREALAARKALKVKRSKKQNRRADKKRKEMSKAVKRNKPIIDKLKRTLGTMGKEIN